jgi:hypothetical protein
MTDVPHPPAGRFSRRRAFAVIGSALAVALQPIQAVAAATRRYRVICKASWGARPRTGSFHYHRIERITVHHSAVTFWDNRRAPARFRAHQRAHQERGWPDIAYHLLIDRRGHVYRGRPLWARGDTATNYNPHRHLLVMCEGNFDEQSPTKDQLRALIDVLAWACERYDLSVWRINGHRRYASTACPGKNLSRLLTDGTIRRRVRSRIKNGGTSLVKICGDAGDALVARIVSGEV